MNIWLIGLAMAIPIVYLIIHNEPRILITGLFVAGLLLIWTRNITMGIMATFLFLLTVGDIRRIVDMITNGPTGLDPLLLVGAAISVYGAVPLFFGLKLTDTISKAALALMAVMILEIFNPRQGPLTVGFAGALFYIIPFLWFWIGRRYATEKLLYTLIYKVFVPMGILAAVLGIIQTYIGFLPWEDIWVKSLGHMYELSAGHLRSFGYSSNSLEYNTLMQIAATCMIAAVLNRRRAYILVLPILLTAILLASSRGGILRIVFASAMMWAVRGKNRSVWIPKLIFGLALGIGFLFYSATRAEGNNGETIDAEHQTTAQSATAHVTGGLAHPFDEKHSTAGIHVQIIGEALLRGFTYPIGYGLGAVTLAANKFNGDDMDMVSSEFDLSDAFTSMGLVGGLINLFIFLAIIREALRYKETGPTALALPIIGILMGGIGGWSGIGQYPIGPFMMFLLGFIVRNQTMPNVERPRKLPRRRDITLQAVITGS